MAREIIDLVSEDEGTAHGHAPSLTFIKRKGRTPLIPKKFVPTPVKALSFSTKENGSSKQGVKQLWAVKPEPDTKVKTEVVSKEEELYHGRIPEIRDEYQRQTIKGEDVEEDIVDDLCEGLLEAQVSDRSPIVCASLFDQAEASTSTSVLTRSPPISHKSTRIPHHSKIDDGSEEDWIPTKRTPWKSKKRVVRIDTDSDSEPASPPVRTSQSVPSPETVIDFTLSDNESGPSDRSDPVPGLWDHSDDEEEEEGRGRGTYDIQKHYDESDGSLRDFIVDDSDLSDGEVKDEEDEDELSDADERSYADTDGRKPTRSSVSPKRTVLIIDDSDEVDEVEGNEHDDLYYSPAKRLHTLPDFSTLTLDDSPPPLPKPIPKKREVPPTPSSRDKRSWTSDRVVMAQEVFDDLNKRVFEGKLGACKMEWSKRLLTTAGQAASKRSTKADGSKVEETRIVLSEKVLTGKEQILCTVAHEMCHVASWIISNERKNPHGRVFKSWGRKVMRARPDIEVTTKHSYEIEYKYEWKCSNAICGKIYRRHSKSIDTKKQACGTCRCPLEPLFQTKSMTPFQLYLKENMAHAKTAMPNASHGEVMRALSRQWNAEGPEADHLSHWKALAAAAA